MVRWRGMVVAVLALPLAACFIVLDGFGDYDTEPLKREAGAFGGDGSGGLGADAKELDPKTAGFRFHLEPATLAARQHSTNAVRIILERDPGFDEPVTFGLAAPPAGITAPNITSPADSLDIAIADAPPGASKLDVVGLVKAGKLTVPLPLQVQLGAGKLDPTFAKGGVATASVVGGFASVAVQPDGKIVVGGFRLPEPKRGMIARFNADGALDTTFATGGIYQVSQLGITNRIEVLADGKILAATKQTSQRTLALTRLTTAGMPDTSLDGDGTLILSSSSIDYSLLGVNGDKPVIAAKYTDSSFDPVIDLVLARYLATGAKDPAWNSGSDVHISYDESPSDLAVSKNGDVTTAISRQTQSPIDPPVANPMFDVIRLGSTGQKDSAFGTNGIASGTFPVTGTKGYAVVHRILVDPSGNTLVAGESADEKHDPFPAPSIRMALARMTSKGNLDPSFGTAGFARITSLPQSWANDVALQADGKIIVVGTGIDGTKRSMVVGRLTATGALDDSFRGPEGGEVAVISVGPSADAWAVAVDPTSGAIIVVGSSTDASVDASVGTQSVIARLVP